MKKANLTNLLLILFIYGLVYLGVYILNDQGIDIFFKLDLDNNLKSIILISLDVLVMGASVIFASVVIFERFIAHKRKVKLTTARYLLVISSLIMSYGFLLFKTPVYFYFGNVLVLYFIYFLSLYIQDRKFIHKQQAPSLIVNTTLVEQFLALFGGKDNIISVNYEQSRLRVELKDVKKLQLAELNNLGAKGAFIAGNKLQAVIGSSAEALENAINAYLSIPN